jgi:hypothetical protein
MNISKEKGIKAMRKWVVTMVYSTTEEFEVKAETYDEAIEKARDKAANFTPDVKDLECELEDYEAWPDDEE